MAYAFTYMLNGEYDTNNPHLFTGTDAAVQAEWTVLTATTPGIKTNGDIVTWAAEYNPVTLNTPPPGANAPTQVIAGTIISTYGAQPAIPKSVQGGSGVITLVNGANNDVNAPNYLNLIQGPTGAFNITGISGGIDGKTVTIINNVAQNLTITNDSGSSAAANRIYTYGATVTTGAGVVTLVYDGPLAHWVVQSFTV